MLCGLAVASATAIALPASVHAEALPISAADASLLEDVNLIDFNALIGTTLDSGGDPSPDLVDDEYTLSLGLTVSGTGAGRGLYASNIGQSVFTSPPASIPSGTNTNTAINFRPTGANSPTDGGVGPSVLTFEFNQRQNFFGFFAVVADTHNIFIELLDRDGMGELVSRSTPEVLEYEIGISNAGFVGVIDEISFAGVRVSAMLDTFEVDALDPQPLDLSPTDLERFRIDNLQFGIIPEPASLGLVALGVGLMAMRRRRED
ncbi:MAG: PEP-CTERM sorting domain-containing protein [Planctomycetota bacterium]